MTVEYHWLSGQYDRLLALLGDLVRRRVAVIAIPGMTSGAAEAKAATATIPIVFGVGEDPVKLGLVASLARPGGNATGVNFFVQEINSKRLALLHELLPKATRIAVLVNPGNPQAREVTLKDMQETARALGLEIQVIDASSSGEIDAAFAAFAREHPNALFVGGDAFLASRRVQLATLAARDRLPASYPIRGCKARFRLAGSPLPGGSRTLWIPTKGFRSQSHPPFLDLSWRKFEPPSLVSLFDHLVGHHTCRGRAR